MRQEHRQQQSNNNNEQLHIGVEHPERIIMNELQVDE
jgi:hypothetical protein